MIILLNLLNIFKEKIKHINEKQIEKNKIINIKPWNKIWLKD